MLSISIEVPKQRKSEIKFNNAHFNQVIVIFSQYFNRSALDDVESQLITYFSADCGNANGAVSFDSSTIINGNGGNSVNEYKDRGEVATKVIIPLWEMVLYPKGWVKTQTLEKVSLKRVALIYYQYSSSLKFPPVIITICISNTYIVIMVDG